MTDRLSALAPEDILLQAKHVTKVYPGTVALKDVDFNIYRGKVNVLIGENGAGKSTLMKILAGVEQAIIRAAMLDGQEIHVVRHVMPTIMASASSIKN